MLWRSDFLDLFKDGDSQIEQDLKFALTEKKESWNPSYSSILNTHGQCCTYLSKTMPISNPCSYILGCYPRFILDHMFQFHVDILEL